MARPLTSHGLIQEVAPVGGFKPINYRRAIPNRGFGPWTIAAASAFALTYGFYQIGQGNLQRRFVFVCVALLIDTPSSADFLAFVVGVLFWPTEDPALPPYETRS